MISMPHDTTDVLLAPVALALDQQLQQCSELSRLELLQLVVLSTDRTPRDGDSRRDLLLAALTRDIDTHDWTLAWEPRGLALGHNGHRLVLGLPASVLAFVAG